MRALVIANLFGLRPGDAPPRPSPTIALPDDCWKPGGLTLITGPSGSGKSSLLRQLPSMRPGRWIDLDRLRLPPRPVIECFASLPLGQALHLLGRVGLAEARCYLSVPAQLSTGQRWRFRLARGLYVAWRSRGPCFLVADEFAAALDRITALTVSHLLGRALRDPLWAGRPPPAAFLASSHEDLLEALSPDWVIDCDYHDFHIRRGPCPTHPTSAGAMPADLAAPASDPSPTPSIELLGSCPDSLRTP